VIGAGEATGTDTDDALRSFLDEARRGGHSARDAVAAAVARFGIGRREAYAAWEAPKRDPSA